MSDKSLEEVMDEVVTVVDGLNGEVNSYELTKEQYEWFLMQASKAEELEKEKQAILSLCEDFREDRIAEITDSFLVDEILAILKE